MHDILMWIAIASLVVLVSTTGMYINRFFIHRAHRRALAELHRRTSESERANGGCVTVGRITQGQNIDLRISSDFRPESEVTCSV